MKKEVVFVEMELDTTEAEKAIDRLQEKVQKLEGTLERCAQDEEAKETDSFATFCEKVKLYRELREEMREFTSPMLHVCTQSGRSIVAVYNLYAETVSKRTYMIFADHNGDQRWQVLGMYRTKERMLQIYEEMLQHSKTNPDEVYQMPQE